MALVILAACGGKLDGESGSVRGNARGGPPSGAMPAPPSTSSGAGPASPPNSVPPAEPDVNSTTLAVVNGVFYVMASDAAHLYVAGSTPTIERISKSSGAVTVLDSQQDSVQGLAVDDAFLYFARLTKNDVVRMPKTGGAVEVLASGQKRPWNLTIDGTNVYWACEGEAEVGQDPPPALLPGARIASVAKSGGPVRVLSDNEQRTLHLTIDGDFVYFTRGAVGAATGGVARVPKAGGAVETLAAGLGMPWDLVVANGWVGWTDTDRFSQVPISGGTVIDIVDTPGQWAVGAVATDGQRMFYGVSRGRSYVKGVNPGEAASQLLAASAFPTEVMSASGPVDIITDQTRIYWMDYGGGGPRGNETFVRFTPR